MIKDIKELEKILNEDLIDLNKMIFQQENQLKYNVGARIYVQLMLKKLKEEDKPKEKTDG